MNIQAAYTGGGRAGYLPIPMLKLRELPEFSFLVFGYFGLIICHSTNRTFRARNDGVNDAREKSEIKLKAGRDEIDNLAAKAKNELDSQVGELADLLVKRVSNA